MKYSLTKEIVVWLMIISGVLIFSAFAFIISSNQGSFFGSYFIYKTQIQDSSGINVGTKVNIHGSRTGNVMRMNILDSGLVELNFTIKKSHRFIINTSSVVELKNAGALGDRYLNVLTTDTSAHKLKANSVIPYKKSSSLLSVLMGDGKKSKKSLQNILTQVESVLKRVDKKELSEILKNLNSILKKIESGQGTLGALINNPALYNRLLILLGERPKKNYLEDLSKKSK